MKQRVPKSLDEGVMAKLELESYALPEKMAKLRIAFVDKLAEPETSVSVVSHQNATTAEVLERLLKRMEKSRRMQRSDQSKNKDCGEDVEVSEDMTRVEGDE